MVILYVALFSGIQGRKTSERGRQAVVSARSSIDFNEDLNLNPHQNLLSFCLFLSRCPFLKKHILKTCRYGFKLNRVLREHEAGTIGT